MIRQLLPNTNETLQCSYNVLQCFWRRQIQAPKHGLDRKGCVPTSEIVANWLVDVDWTKHISPPPNDPRGTAATAVLPREPHGSVHWAVDHVLIHRGTWPCLVSELIVPFSWLGCALYFNICCTTAHNIYVFITEIQSVKSSKRQDMHGLKKTNHGKWWGISCL